MKALLVYADFEWLEKPALVGELGYESLRGSDSYAWLNSRRETTITTWPSGRTDHRRSENQREPLEHPRQATRHRQTRNGYVWASL